MGELDDLLETIRRIHAAGLSPAVWPDALAAISQMVGGIGATMERIDRNTLRHRSFHGYGVPPAQEVAYLSEYAALNPRLPAALRQKAATTTSDYDILDERGMDRSPFYANFLAPMDMRYWVAGVLDGPEDELWAVTVQRSVRQGHVQRREVELMARLLPHASQALDVARRLEAAGNISQSMEQALDWLIDGVLVLDADGQAVQANNAAQAMMRQGDGLRVRQGAVEFVAPEAERAFRAALQAIKSTRRGPAIADFAAARPGDRPPYTIAVRAIAGEAAGRAVALLFVHDPLAESASSIDLLRSAFGLTPAEAHLADALRRGTSPDAYATANGVSPNTVYTHLRRLKDKCGQPRIAGLIHTLNSVRTTAKSPQNHGF